MTIIDKMYELFKRTGKTHKEFTESLGLSVGQVSAWRRRGTDPPAALLCDICRFFGVTLEELLGDAPGAPAAPPLSDNERDLLGALGRFSDERMAAKFVGRAEALADEMLYERSRAKRVRGARNMRGASGAAG